MGFWQILNTGPEGNSSFCFPRISMFPFIETLKRKTSNGNSNGGRRSTFAGNNALLPSDAIDFALLHAQRLLAGNSFIVRCDLQVTNESARCWGKFFSYITILLV